jgi:hypothetical protein
MATKSYPVRPRINEAGIPPPLESALGNQHKGQQTELDVKETMEIGEEPNLAKEQKEKERLQRNTQEGNERAEDKTENSTWCCGCGRMEIPAREMQQLRVQPCPSCMQIG